MLLSKKSRKKKIDLILTSSGVRAPCFIGGIQGILEKGYNIERIAGSSGGAIVAAGYALGMSISELEQIALSAPYDTFREFKYKNPLSLTNPSVYTGQGLDNFYKSVFGDAVLKDFQIDCKISVITIIGRNRIVLDRESYPDLPVWKAVRMSSTIPFIFPYLKLNDKPVTDGGLSTGIFEIFPDNIRPALALMPRANPDIVRKYLRTVNSERLFIWNYLKIIMEYFLDAAENQHVPEDQWKKTVVIPTNSISSFSFTLTKEDVKNLIDSGLAAVVNSEALSNLKRRGR